MVFKTEQMSTYSTMRRRFLGDSSSEPSRASSPNPTVRDGEAVTLVATSKLRKLTQKRSKRRQFSVFGLGGLLGILIAAFFAQQHHVINLEGLMDLNLDTLFDAIPAGIVNDAKDLTVSLDRRFLVGVLKAETDSRGSPSDMSGRRSTTIHSPSASTCRVKASRLNILSS